MARKIAFYDSGIGGLTVLREFISLNPDVDEIIYVGDTEYMPYGLKTACFVEERMHKIARFIEQQQCDAIVLACHTASAVWLERCPNMLLPIVDAIRPTAAYILRRCMVDNDPLTQCRTSAEFIETPILKAGAYMSMHEGDIGQFNNSTKVEDRPNIIIFATQLTIDMGVYQTILAEIYDNSVFIASQALAQQIEDGKKANITELLGVIPNNQQETIVVLACTHFLFAEQEIKNELTKCRTSSMSIVTATQKNNNLPIKIFDPAKIIATEAQKQLADIIKDERDKAINKRLMIKVYTTGPISDYFCAKVLATLGDHDIIYTSPLLSLSS